MKLSRSSRLAAVCIVLFGMLFMQFAAASYICPRTAVGDESGRAAMPAAMGHMEMAGCEGMEKAAAGLCQAHHETSKQSLDKPQLPDLQPFVPVSLALAWHPVALAAGSLIVPPSSSLTRTTAPPIAIRNCCFRI